MFRGVYDFCSVYLSEAHATDEWPLGNHVTVNQHRNIEERACAAARFREATGWSLPIFLDNCSNDFARRFSAHPERFYLFKQENSHSSERPVLCFVAPGRHAGYDLRDLEIFLTRSS